MADYLQYIPEIVNSLKQIKPIKIILFGSYAKGEMNNDSDLDFIVIVDPELNPKTYDQKIELKVNVRKTITKISKKIPIDLLVYTRTEYESLLNQNNSFIQQINKTGKIVYAKAS